MRIVGGRLRGAVLAEVGAGDEAARLRPTSDRVREAIFNLLAHGAYPPIAGTRVLDLFAGTGALGFEALSRGAVQAVFVDDGDKAAALIRANAAKLKVASEVKLIRKDATRPGPCDSDAFSLIFLDPPYGKALGEKALAAALAGGWVAPGAVVVWEESGDISWPAGLLPADDRRYGGTRVHIGRGERGRHKSLIKGLLPD